MERELVTLFAIVAASFACPVLAALVPRKLVPETVLLLVAGMILGPCCLGIAQGDAAVTLLSDLGLGLLFLLAGYEIDPRQLTGRQGRHGLATWAVTFALAIGLVALVPPLHDNDIEWFAVAICLSTTAFGTIMPILKERGVLGTPVGDAVVAYGAWGEICPVIAMALMLSTRKTWVTVAILAAFALIAVVAAVIPRRLWQKGAHLTRFISDNADTNAQMTVRSVIVLLVGLVTVSALFDLDIVLGSFAAGFILRFIIPKGSKGLEQKLNGIGYGFFIPLFFVVSGMAVDPRAVAADPLLLVVFIGALLAVRALPIMVALHLAPETRALEPQGKVSVALYCTTALPLIVAVTAVATDAGAMGPDTASLMVAAGAITVLIMPLMASLTSKTLRLRTQRRPGGRAERP